MQRSSRIWSSADEMAKAIPRLDSAVQFAEGNS